MSDARSTTAWRSLSVASGSPPPVFSGTASSAALLWSAREKIDLSMGTCIAWFVFLLALAGCSNGQAETQTTDRKPRYSADELSPGVPVDVTDPEDLVIRAEVFLPDRLADYQALQPG